jgi:hypothetical protein
MIRLFLLVLFTSIVSIGCSVKSDLSKFRQPSWPIIKPYKQEFNFNDANSAAVSILLRDANGNDLYRFECHNYLYEDDSGFDYSGDFECKLNSLYGEGNSLPTLLTSDLHQPSDWWSRGRFLAGELTEKCIDYPEYGRIRTFRLRGMNIRLELSDIVFASSDIDVEKNVQLKSFRFIFDAKPDLSAATEIAECPAASPCSDVSPPCYSK